MAASRTHTSQCHVRERWQHRGTRTTAKTSGSARARVGTCWMRRKSWLTRTQPPSNSLMAFARLMQGVMKGIGRCGHHRHRHHNHHHHHHHQMHITHSRQAKSNIFYISTLVEGEGAGAPVNSLKVQVICGLVQQQQMRLLRRDPRERNLTPHKQSHDTSSQSKPPRRCSLPCSFARRSNSSFAPSARPR